MDVSLQKAKAYKDLESELDDWLSSADKQLNEISEQEVDVDNDEVVAKVTEKLNNLNAELAANQKTLDKLKGVYMHVVRSHTTYLYKIRDRHL